MEVTSLSAIEHIITHRPERVRRLFISGSQNPRVKAIEDKARKAKIQIDFGAGARPKGEAAEPVRAQLSPFEYTDLRDFLISVEPEKRAMVLALDHLQDPQNFGALCRTAEGLGVAGILLPKDRSVTVGPGVYSASVGAVETIPIVLVTNLADGLRKMKEAGFWIIGTTIGAGATPPWEIPDFEKAVLVLGAELEGLSHGVDKTCDWRTEIPLGGKIQSLNVSVAGAILMYQLQHRLPKA